MKLAAFAAVLALGVGSAFLFAEEKHADKAPATQPAPINKKCAVNKDDDVTPGVTTEYNGKVIGFCCKDCIPDFKKDPEKYMKDLK